MGHGRTRVETDASARRSAAADLDPSNSRSLCERPADPVDSLGRAAAQTPLHELPDTAGRHRTVVALPPRTSVAFTSAIGTRPNQHRDVSDRVSLLERVVDDEAAVVGRRKVRQPAATVEGRSRLHLRFELVAVGVAHERSVVVVAELRPRSGRALVGTPMLHGRRVELSNRHRVRSTQCQVKPR